MSPAVELIPEREIDMTTVSHIPEVCVYVKIILKGFFFKYFVFALTWIIGTSLVVQWLRIPLPIQGIQVQSLVQELRSHMLQGN